MTASHLNLEAPPGFQGIRDDIPLRVYQRNLPHWRQHGATYAVTFRLADSLPQPLILRLKRWKRAETENARHYARSEKLIRQMAIETEFNLDKGLGEAVFNDPVAVKIMRESLVYHQESRCYVSAFTIMPNHIHAVMKPLETYELEDVLKSIRGYSTRQINQALNRTGTLWSREFYDRIIRDESHLYRAIQYIGNNAKKAGIDAKHQHRWIAPEWEQLGWGFRDD